MHDQLIMWLSKYFFCLNEEKRNRFELKANNKYSSWYLNYYCFQLNQSILKV